MWDKEAAGGEFRDFFIHLEYFFKQKQTIANNMFNCILGMCLAHLPARLCLGICEEGRGEEVRGGCGKGWRAHFSAPGCYSRGSIDFEPPIQIYSDHVDRGEQVDVAGVKPSQAGSYDELYYELYMELPRFTCEFL